MYTNAEHICFEPPSHLSKTEVMGTKPNQTQVLWYFSVFFHLSYNRHSSTGSVKEPICFIMRNGWYQRVVITVPGLFLQPNPDAKPNLNPIFHGDPQFVRQVENGKLYVAGISQDSFYIVHLWGK